MNRMSRPLKKIILERFTEKNGNFFYSFEVTPKKGFQVGFEKLSIKPLFIDITWIGDHNLKCDSIHASPAFQLREAIISRSNNLVSIVNSVTCYNLEDRHVDELLSGSGQFPNFTVLRGDVVNEHQKYQYADELITAIREKTGERTHEEGVTIFAAGNPEDDLHFLKRKVDAGVDAILTQLTFSADDFCKFVRDCREAGILVPIIPGLYIPRNLDELSLMLKITKVSMPRELQQQLEGLRDNTDRFQECSLSFTCDLIGNIQRASTEHIKGFHFFTLNNLTMLERLIAVVNFSET